VAYPVSLPVAPTFVSVPLAPAERLPEDHKQDPQFRVGEPIQHQDLRIPVG